MYSLCHWSAPSDGEPGKAITEEFGSFVAFKEQLSQSTIQVQGSGWGVLGWEPAGQRLVIEQVYDHQGNVGNGSILLLVIDAWEHAYYLQYKNARADFVKAFWNIINWRDVGDRYQSAKRLVLP